jgi:hypothetical protein
LSLSQHLPFFAPCVANEKALQLAITAHNEQQAAAEATSLITLILPAPMTRPVMLVPTTVSSKQEANTQSRISYCYRLDFLCLFVLNENVQNSVAQSLAIGGNISPPHKS